MNINLLSHISAGHSLRESVDILPEGDVAVVQLRNTRSPISITWDKATKVELPTKKDPHYLREEDIFLSTRSSSYQATLVRDCPEKAVCAPQFYLIRITDLSKVSAAYLCWQKNKSPAQNYFSRVETGTSIKNLLRKAVEGLEISLPPMAIQKAIADMYLSSFEERFALEQLIHNRQQQFEAIAHGLLQEARTSK